MRAATRACVVALTVGLVAGSPAPSGAAPGASDERRAAPVQVVAKGLNSPFGLSAARNGSIVVAQSGAGEVTLIRRNGKRRTVVSDAAGVAAVASRGKWVWSVIGGPAPDGPPVGGAYGPSKVLRTDLDTGQTTVIADLLQYELDNNPDGQVQEVGGQPVDALSNPFAMTLTPRSLLIADGGANAVLRVNPMSGKVSTFFVPPTVRTKPCLADGVQANPGTVGCDSVPTGVDWRNGRAWVSTLGSEVPGAGRIYKLTGRGEVARSWRGLDGPTGLAVGPGGAVYYSQVFFGGPPGPGVDINKLGRIVRVQPDGDVSTFKASQPTGLLFERGKFHASTRSLNPGKGRVIRIPISRFR